MNRMIKSTNIVVIEYLGIYYAYTPCIMTAEYQFKVKSKFYQS